MKTSKFLITALLTVFLIGCSEDIMDEISQDRNNASSAEAFAILPDVILKSATTTTSTDLAWYASMFIEHSAGQWAQHHEADRRLGLEQTTIFNNHWNGMYDILNMLKILINRCSPDGEEPNNKHGLGIAQILTAYNLATLTDFWGDAPWSEAINPETPKPKFDRQSAIYQDVFTYLENGIANLEAAIAQGGDGPNSALFDYIYSGSNEKWIMAAYSLMARYHMRLSERDDQAASKALTAIANGFQGPADAFLFDKFEAGDVNQNPWHQFRFQRSHLCVAETIHDIMDERNDPRMDVWFSKYEEVVEGDTIMVFRPAPPGEADQVQGGVYSESLITYDPDDVAGSRTRPALLMTYHEMLFIRAEALYRTGGDYTTALQEAIQHSFVFHGLTADEADDYFAADVAARLSADPFDEIITQKYIAMYEHEAMEAYHDYRRTRVIELGNPNNSSPGFPERYQYGLSEESNNPDNFIVLSVFNDKVWWAGGNELAP